MKRRAARWIMVLALAAIAGAATHQTIMRGRAIETTRDAVAAIDESAGRVGAAVADIAAAERSYVAPGQGAEFWSGKVDEALTSGKNALIDLRKRATDPASAARFDSATTRLDDFSAMDARAFELARTGQRSASSDLIFADGYEMLGAVRADTLDAASREKTALLAPLARHRQVQLASIGALAACAVLAIALVMFGGRPAEAVAADVVIAPREPLATATPATVLDDNIGAALDASLEGIGLSDPPVEAFAASDHARPAPRAPRIDLDEAAGVCVDLARLLDARDLQAVLARVASVLGAHGVIVWSIDPSGHLLAPALTHGYDPALVARVGSLPVDTDNATAAAWRAKSVQVVTGALAVPLLTSDGCVGVLALETKDGNERASDVQSLARILAAQLAAIVGPPAAEPRRAAEA